MDAGLLDMLHDAGDIDLVAVGDGIDIDLDRVLQIAVDQHRARARDADGAADVAVEPGGVVDDLHRPAAEHVGRADHHRVADRAARSPRLPAANGRCRCPAGAGRAASAAAGSAGGPRPGRSRRARCRGSGYRARSSAFARLSGVCPPNCTMTPSNAPRELLDPHDLDHVLGGQRLEIEPVGGVVIGRDGLRVAVDHDRLDAGLAQAVGGMDAAIVELDALADAVGAAAEDDRPCRARSDRPRIPGGDTRRPRSRNTCTGSATANSAAQVSMRL